MAPRPTAVALRARAGDWKVLTNSLRVTSLPDPGALGAPSARAPSALGAPPGSAPAVRRSALGAQRWPRRPPPASQSTALGSALGARRSALDAAPFENPFGQLDDLLLLFGGQPGHRSYGVARACILSPQNLDPD